MDLLTGTWSPLINGFDARIAVSRQAPSGGNSFWHASLGGTGLCTELTIAISTLSFMLVQSSQLLRDGKLKPLPSLSQKLDIAFCTHCTANALPTMQRTGQLTMAKSTKPAKVKAKPKCRRRPAKKRKGAKKVLAPITGSEEFRIYRVFDPEANCWIRKEDVNDDTNRAKKETDSRVHRFGREVGYIDDETKEKL